MRACVHMSVYPCGWLPDGSKGTWKLVLERLGPCPSARLQP